MDNKAFEKCATAIMKPRGLVISKRFAYKKIEEELYNKNNLIIFRAGFDAGMKEAVRRLKKECKKL